MGCIRISPFAMQIWVVTVILVMMAAHGMVLGITSSMLPALQAVESDVKADLEQLSWLSASVGVGSIVMYIATTYLMARRGRRHAAITGTIPAVLGALTCYSSSRIDIIIFGRFLSGMGVAAGLVGAVVIGEYTSPEHRGTFLNLKSGALYVGSTAAHILGNYFHWRTVFLTITILYMASVAMVYTWPESPAWLATQQRYDECTTCFYELRGKSERSTRELSAMIMAQREQPFDTDTSLYKDIARFWEKFTKRNFVKPLFIYMFVAILLEASGRHTFAAYALNILHQMNPNPSNSFCFTLGVDTIMTISALISTILVKVMKRRTLLFYSGTSSVFILWGVCLYYFLQSISLISQKYDAVSILLFGLYFGVVNLGCTPICLSLIGEMFPLEHRPTAVSTGGILIAIFMVITLKTTPLMLATIQMYGTFAVYGLSMAVCLLILYFTLPETKDKTLQEIDDYFSDPKMLNNEITDDEHATLTLDNGLHKHVTTHP